MLVVVTKVLLLAFVLLAGVASAAPVPERAGESTFPHRYSDLDAAQTQTVPPLNAAVGQEGKSRGIVTPIIGLVGGVALTRLGLGYWNHRKQVDDAFLRRGGDPALVRGAALSAVPAGVMLIVLGGVGLSEDF